MSSFISCGSGTRGRGENPLLSEWDTPYGIAPFEQIEPSHYLEAFEVAFEELERDVTQIVESEATPTFESVIVALDRSGVRLRELKDLYEMSEAAMASEEFRRVSEEIMPRISAAEDAVLMNEALFERIRTIYDGRAAMKLDAVQLRLLERTYERFVRGGALLDDELKGRLAEINSREAVLNATFSHNLIAENDSYILNLNQKQLDGIPIPIRFVARAEAERRGLTDRWVFTLNQSSMIPFLTYSTDRALRESIYKAYINRGSNGGEHDNTQIVRDVTKLRQERARLLGYKSHADYVISQQMAGDVDSVYVLLDRVWTAALASANSELRSLTKKFRPDVKDDSDFAAWDWWYYAEKVRSSNYGISDESISGYFTAENVRRGAFLLANRLYGITFRPIKVPLYDPNTMAFEVLDRDNSHLGVLYFDLFSRSNKGQGAWCGNLREQRYDGDERIAPVVAVVCNFPQPTESVPSLLNLDQVETLFHEFGHALHFIFQDVPYHGLAAVEGDFVEFPSQVMENWALQPSLVKEYAFHYSSKRPLTDELLGKIERSRSAAKGFETVAYTAAALLDLELQRLPMDDCDSLDIKAFETKLLSEKRGLIPQIEPRYHLTNFSHLFTYDYSAGYYFYLWAEVLDQDCFDLFRRSRDLYSKEIADKLRYEILERGSMSDGMTLYKNFKGGAPDIEPMLRSKGLLE